MISKPIRFAISFKYNEPLLLSLIPKYLCASLLFLKDKNKLYTVEESINLVKETATTKFDSTVEVAFKLNLDTKKADQQLRGATVLPNGIGKTKKHAEMQAAKMALKLFGVSL